MFRLILVIVLLSSMIQASTQLILVISEDFNATTGKLYTFEKKTETFERVFDPFRVNLGRSGLGWGEGMLELTHEKNEPFKREGDGRAPSGIFALGDAFGYAKSISSKLSYTQATQDLICVDDVNDTHYNQLLHVSDKSSIKSYEDMLRNDNLYEIGLIVKHNEKNIPKKGSCIFLHVQKDIDAPTSGCTSMSKDHLSQLLHWLAPNKQPVLIQIPKNYYPKIIAIYPGLPKLL
jgi:L,D-peptidoglycan transpeptidase YkuD (ErfK/YbiS/YcfS/YnhG family)